MDPIVLLTRMVEIPSLSGDEAALADFLVETMRGLGFQAYVDEAGNAVGTLGDGPTEIVLLGHLDTVARRDSGPNRGRSTLWARQRGRQGAAGRLHRRRGQVGALPGKRIVIVGSDRGGGGQLQGGAIRRSRPSRRPACVIGEPSGTRAVNPRLQGTDRPLRTRPPQARCTLQRRVTASWKRAWSSGTG